MRRHAGSGRACCLGLVLVGAVKAGTLEAQVVEEFYPAIGPPSFAEQPLVVGSAILWARASARKGFLGRLQCQATSVPGAPVVDLFPYPTSRLPPLTSGNLVFRAQFHDTEDTDGMVYAQEILGPCEVAPGLVPVHAFGGLVAVNRSYLFHVEFDPESHFDRRSGIVYAKPTARLYDLGRDAYSPLARFQSFPLQSRVHAASDDYFAFVDVPVGSGGEPDTWRVYVHSMASVASGAPGQMLDTGASYMLQPFDLGVYIDLAGSLLVYQGQLRDGENAGARGVFLADLSHPERASVPVALTTDPEVTLTWPSVSEEYVVWAEVTSFFWRRAMGIRLVDGRPEGEPFEIGPGGSWIVVRGNLAAANGRTRSRAGGPSENAIVAWELESTRPDGVGDADGDGTCTLADAITILHYLFRGGPPPRLRRGDVDSSGAIDITDAVRLLSTLFRERGGV